MVWNRQISQTHHGVTEGGAFVIVNARLGGGDDKALRLDGSGSQKRFPVGQPSGHGKSRWISNDVGPHSS